MQEKFIRTNSDPLFYKITGSGIPVVLLHGFAEDGNIWDNQVVFLKNTFKIIIPDIPGSGQSGILTSPQTGLDDYASCIHEILSAEKITHCIMIGHSMGGYIALAFAEKFPGILMGLGLFHSSAYADDNDKIETRKKAISFIEDNGAEAFLKTSVPALFYDPEKNKKDIDALLEKGKNFTSEALIQYYGAMIKRPDRTDVLKKAAIPVLFIMGEHDKAVPFQHSLEQSYIPAHSYIYILRNSGHMGMLEETGKANEALAEFLQNAG